MIGPTIVDAGPIVALVLHRDLHHDWAEALFDQIRPPLLTCEAVVTAACFLVRSSHGGQRSVLALVANGTFVIDFRLGPHGGLRQRPDVAGRRLPRAWPNFMRGARS